MPWGNSSGQSLQNAAALADKPISATSRAASLSLQCLHQMVISREMDRREAMLLRQGKAWFQIPSMGHEGLAILATELTANDYLFPGYRDRALMLMRGITPMELALDFFGRSGSSTEGRSMPGHFSSREHNVFSVASPVASQCLPAVGVAWGMKLSETDHAVLCTIGDAATRQGEFFEAICQAVQDKLPVIFVVEDNGYGISTKTDNMLPMRLGILSKDLYVQVDGRDIFVLGSRFRDCLDKARRGDGPTILWCELDRQGSHTSSDDHRIYRPASEVDELGLRDPLELAASALIHSGELSEAGFDQMAADARRLIASTYRDAEAVALPSQSSVQPHLFAPAKENSILQPSLSIENPTTMAVALNRILRAGLETFPNLLMFGEDIADPKGGVFGLTKGLSSDFPGRVTNSPLAEATIIGAAVGLAATGFRPVFEIQFVDFLTAGFNSLASQMATLRWRSAGQWSCPAVLYAPYGSYTPGGGIWHSQSNDGWWAHMPGLRVAVPSTPADAAGLFWSAFQDDDPTLILIPKFAMRERIDFDPGQRVKFGEARVRRSGSDVTLVGWGNTMAVALEAAERLQKERSIHAEVIDLVSLVPCDWKTVETSLAKTGRIVVIQEDGRTCGFGQAVISEMTTNPDRFYTLSAPPRLIAREDGYIPYTPHLEAPLLPSAESVIAAVLEILE